MVEEYSAFVILSPDDDNVVIALPENSGVPRKLALSFNEASTLAMSLPRLLTEAINRKFGDDSLRHVYPVQGYTVECASDLRHLLLTLSVSKGFRFPRASILGSFSTSIRFGPSCATLPRAGYNWKRRKLRERTDIDNVNARRRRWSGSSAVWVVMAVAGAWGGERNGADDPRLAGVVENDA